MVLRFRILISLLATAFSPLAAPAADPVLPPLPPEITFPSKTVIKVTETGAIADGQTLATGAIAKAIDRAAAAGGGIVEFPDSGRHEYLTGAIHLKSNITLQIDSGVTLKFTTDRAQYPLVKTRYECVDIMNYSPLIYAYQCENIRITGDGTIDGQGQAWWTWARNVSANRGPAPSGGQALRGANSGQGVGPDAGGRRLILEYTNDREGKYPLDQRVFGDKVQGFRPCAIEPYACKNVLIENITLKNSPFWNIHPVYSENVTVRGVTVEGNGPNTDGCDPDSCNTVLIDHDTFATGDDCIAIKSGRDGDGIRRNAPCENITVRNCTMKGGHGAITMGSETSGGIRHIFAENCNVDGPDSAIRLKSTRGRGGGVEDVYFRNITTNHTAKYAITIDMMYSRTEPAAKSETTPVFKDIRIENFSCGSSPEALYVMGLQESPVQNLVLKNVALSADKGARLQYVDGLVRDNVAVQASTGDAWEMKDVKE